METTVHITYPESGIEISELKRILSVLEKANTLFSNQEEQKTEGKIIRVKEGSIILEIVWSILPSAFSLLANYLNEKLKKNTKSSLTEASVNFDSEKFSLNITYKRKEF